MKALVFGSLNLDTVYQVDHFVRPGETLSAASQTVNAGGKGLNQSLALARAGAEVYHAGCLGIGGEALRKLLDENGVDTRFLRDTPTLQGNAVIQVAPDGQNCILLFGGSNQCLTSQQVEDTLSYFQAGDWLVLQNEVNEIQRMVDSAFSRGMQIVLNPSPFNDALLTVDFSKLSWLIVNEIEAEQLCGSRDPETAWRLLRQRYPGLSLVVTLGSKGSAAYTDDEALSQSAFSVPAVDTTGAGDTFTGFFIAARMEGKSLRDSLRLASMAAAISVTRNGAAPSIPSEAEVLEALKTIEA